MIKHQTIMRNIILTCSFFVFITTISAQESDNHKAIKETIETFFKGLHKGDSAIVSSVLHKSIKTQTTFTNRKGENILVTETKDKLLNNIANKKPEHVYLEKLLSWDINIDKSLASVWTPYEFYFNNTFSHCGANSFQLFNNNGKWEIIYLVDIRRKNGCKNNKK